MPKNIVEIWDIRTIEKKNGDLGTCILQASKDVGECRALLVHSDADNLGYWEAREDRFTPGYTLVQNYSGWSCQNLVPVIPVREIEAWMLADFEALSAVLGISLERREFNLSPHIAAVEGLADPKRMLNDIARYVNADRSHRCQPVDLTTKFEPLARQVDLFKLFEVPAYREFVRELTQTLEALHFIPFDSTSHLLKNNRFSRY